MFEPMKELNEMFRIFKKIQPVGWAGPGSIQPIRSSVRNDQKRNEAKINNREGEAQ